MVTNWIGWSCEKYPRNFNVDHSMKSAYSSRQARSCFEIPTATVYDESVHRCVYVHIVRVFEHNHSPSIYSLHIQIDFNLFPSLLKQSIFDNWLSSVSILLLFSRMNTLVNSRVYWIHKSLLCCLSCILWSSSFIVVIRLTRPHTHLCVWVCLCFLFRGISVLGV